MPARLELTSETRFGRLHIVEEAAPVSRAPHRGVFRMFRLRCSCGGEITTRLNSLRSGRVNSCGCLVADTNVINAPKITKHGDARGIRAPEYHSWHGIIERCTNPNSAAWKYYGGRGITICDEWRHNYQAFLSAVGRKPSPTHSIDRINNDKGYEPGNVRWATKSEQAYNRRNPNTVRKRK